MYFAEPVTRKRIWIFSQQGKREAEISLEQAAEILPEIQAVAILDIDSILLASPYYGDVVRIDRSGKVHEHYEPSRFFHESPERRLHAGFPAKGDFLFEGCWLFKADWWFEDLERRHQEGRMTDLDYFREHLRMRTYAPTMVKLCPLDTDSFTVQLGPDSIHQGLFADDSVRETFDFLNYCRTPNGNFYFSTFGSVIYRIDPTTLQLTPTLEVSSSFTSIGYVPPTAEESFEDPKAFSRPMDTHGFITQIIYHELSERYLVQILHAGESGQDWYERSFSINVYDKNFGLLEEILFNGAEHVCNLMISTKAGILIERKQPSSPIPTSHIFDRYVPA